MDEKRVVLFSLPAKRSVTALKTGVESEMFESGVPTIKSVLFGEI